MPLRKWLLRSLPPRPYDPATLQRFVTAIRERMRGA
jgi:hypothetical protein